MKRGTGTIKRTLSFIILISLCLFILQCKATRHAIEDAVAPITGQLTPEHPPALSPEKAYAGEVLAYLMQLILGQAGNPDVRNEWATRGLEATLDFNNISEVMTNPEKLKTDLLVLDTNVMGLSEVLYYYDRNLNLIKDNNRHASIYPAPELIAIRLLLLQKISRGETIDLKSLLDRKALLFDRSAEPTAEDLDAVNLNMEEMQLLMDIFENEPYLYDYLNSNFLVEAFYKTGVIEKDDFVKKIVQKANYKQYNCRHSGGSYNKDAVKISFLPSMTKEFYYGDSHEGLSHYGFKPTEHFNEMTNKLKRKILEKTKSIVYAEITKGTATINTKEWETIWEGIVKEKIAFYKEDEKPLVIYPHNAPQVVEDVCPKTDFAVILLGKDVYLSLNLEPGKDFYPDVNRLYIDIMDVKYDQYQEEIDQISEFIYSQLNAYLKP